MVELSDHVLHLTLLLSCLVLDHREILLEPLLLVSDLLLIVFNSSIVALLCTLPLLLESSLKAVTLDLEEALKLVKLLL